MKQVTFQIPDVKHWKTTCAGLSTAIGVGLHDYLQTGTVSLRGLLLAIGIAALGYLAADRTSVPKEQSSEAAPDQKQAA